MAAAAVPVALAAGGALVSAMGSIQGGQSQQAGYDYNAQVDRINAGSALQTSAAEEQRLQIGSQVKVAQAANLYGGQGISASGGSPLDVLAFQATQGALDSEIARYRGQTTANSDLNASTQQTFQGQQAATAGDVKAASTLLTAGLNYATGMNPRGSAAAADTSGIP